MAKWVVINWTGKFRFRGNPYYRDFQAKGKTEEICKKQILDYILSMGVAGFVLEDQNAEVAHDP